VTQAKVPPAIPGRFSLLSQKEQVSCSNDDNEVQDPDCLVDRLFVLRLVEGSGETDQSEGRHMPQVEDHKLVVRGIEALLAAP
jgi:hypothetical protein